MTTGEAPDRWLRSSGRPARDTLIVLARRPVQRPRPGECGGPRRGPRGDRLRAAAGAHPGPGPAGTSPAFSYWAICVAATLESEASAFRSGSRPWHPLLTQLIDPLIQPHPVRSGAFLVWLLAGWALVRR